MAFIGKKERKAACCFLHNKKSGMQLGLKLSIVRKHPEI
jgi:hypothetical protein